MEKILLSGFNLEPEEMKVINGIIKNYVHKISERVDYEYIKLSLKITRRGKVRTSAKISKAFLHEIRGSIKVKEKIFTADITDYNLYSALAEVLKKLLHEVTHKKRTVRQMR